MLNPADLGRSETLFAETFQAFIDRRAREGSRPPWSSEQTGFWLGVTHRDAASREQGWKLHVSANVHAASAVLERVLEVLSEVPVSFKLARSPRRLLSLNRGENAKVQIGKFITIYPSNDEQAVALALALDARTKGMSGPAIASDRQLRPGSLVHYRYGGFGARYLQTSIGAIVPALRTPEGTLVSDLRSSSFEPPSWAADPFEAAGVVERAPEPRRLIKGRYLPAGTFYTSPHGTVSLGVDVVGGRRCILKAARNDLTLGESDVPSSHLLRREAETLKTLAPEPRIPTLYDVFEERGHVYLVMEDIEGETFEDVIAQRRGTHQPITGREIVAWGKEIAGALAAIHARGHAYLDLRASNVIVTRDALRLVDLDAASPLGQEQRASRGTRGYLAPERAAGGPSIPSVGHDVYALGAMLYLATTGAEPSNATDPFDLLARPLSVMAPTVPPGLPAVIERCLARDASDRFPTMAAVMEALDGLDASAIDPEPWGAAPAPQPPRDRWRARARELGETMVAVAVPVASGEGLLWNSSHGSGAGLRSRDVNSGSAGTLLALCELADELSDPRMLEAAHRGALGLDRAPRPEGELAPGLYVGEGGVIAALLRAGQVLAAPRWIEAAEARSEVLAQIPYRSPDLFNGTSGRLRVHLLLWDETRNPAELDRARRAGEELLRAATVDEKGGRRWVIPPGYDSMSGEAHLGYAHGAAGIADALLDLFEATGDERYAAAARGAAEWIARLAITPEGLPAASVWPSREGDPPTSSFWCHGAAGIGLFLLRAGAAGVFPDGLAWAERAAWSAARTTRWAGPTQCHGLSGNIELLLDCYRVTRDDAYLTEASVLASLLDAHGAEHEGRTVWPSESPTVFSPDYMVGYAGVATCFLRLSSPEREPLLRRRVQDGCRWPPGGLSLQMDVG